MTTAITTTMTAAITADPRRTRNIGTRNIGLRDELC